jgi:hypothetical protein
MTARANTEEVKVKKADSETRSYRRSGGRRWSDQAQDMIARACHEYKNISKYLIVLS